MTKPSHRYRLYDFMNSGQTHAGCLRTVQTQPKGGGGVDVQPFSPAFFANALSKRRGE
jgi:hypothetical protein